MTEELMFAAMSRKAWQLSLILRPFGVRQPGSLKIGEYDSLCEAEHAATLPKQGKDSFEES
ncbi:MAG: hypothetical protein F4Y49_06335 [Dehalococcoidia bacterium]|nr:hypothetical protein [Dehalococcoidia bacterium]